MFLSLFPAHYLFYIDALLLLLLLLFKYLNCVRNKQTLEKMQQLLMHLNLNQAYSTSEVTRSHLT